MSVSIDPTTGEFVGEHEMKNSQGEVSRTTEWFGTEQEARQYSKNGYGPERTRHAGMATAGSNKKIHRIALTWPDYYTTQCGVKSPKRPQTTQDQLPECKRCFKNES